MTSSLQPSYLVVSLVFDSRMVVAVAEEVAGVLELFRRTSKCCRPISIVRISRTAVMVAVEVVAVVRMRNIN